MFSLLCLNHQIKQITGGTTYDDEHVGSDDHHVCGISIHFNWTKASTLLSFIAAFRYYAAKFLKYMTFTGNNVLFLLVAVIVGALFGMIVLGIMRIEFDATAGKWYTRVG